MALPFYFREAGERGFIPGEIKKLWKVMGDLKVETGNIASRRNEGEEFSLPVINDTFN